MQVKNVGYTPNEYVFWKLNIQQSFQALYKGELRVFIKVNKTSAMCIHFSNEELEKWKMNTIVEFKSNDLVFPLKDGVNIIFD